ncbi:MAG: demethoxyubiquinone hydroxylase family protein [Betaproteobacteria bacterium]|nr:demethoxyubiquinone hydroxylase family protein [Rubrivivax sp.]
MTTPQAPREDDTLTVLYDGGCPLCRREIAHVQGLAQRQGDAGLCFVDISADAACDADERAALLARFHVQRGDGTRLDGAAAFVAMWQRLPGWRWLARLARLPGAMPLLEASYRGFLRVRPALQRLAWRWEPTPGLSQHLERELRSDHAGETGAVFIYRGIAAVARWRGQPGDAELLAFAQRHGQAEAEHLRLVEEWLPRHRRSHLLGPWRLAGWLTGALPALAGARAVHATIAAVETFVDRHYQQQIDHIATHGAPEGLLPLLQRCQADECHHRDEAAALAAAAGPVPWPLRAWCAVVGQGSAAAVVLARRV